MIPVPPTPTRPARLEPIPKLPIFLDLAGKPALVTGGSPGSAWKAELLAAAGARVVVHTGDPCLELTELAQAHPGQITITPRPWTDLDLAQAAIAIGGEPGEEATRLAAAARAARTPVNVIDTGALCDFQFGSIVNRAPLLIAISSDGASPVLAQAVRRRIEAILPPGLARWAAAARAFRRNAARALPDRAQRRRFWDKVAAQAFAPGPSHDPALALARFAAEPTHMGGEIVIVGAGPGDPDLLTLAAVRELQAADVILYDRLVGQGVLELARREARRIQVGKRGHGASVPQSEITAELVRLARAGERVVRLKGGDPAYFARTGEEVAAARAAGIAVRIVPGVTAPSAAAAALGLSLTHRAHGRRVQFVSGHDLTGTLPLGLALGDPETTTAVYMGRDTAADLARTALAQGLPDATPAILLSDIGGAHETHIRTRLADLARDAARLDPAYPALILLGAALGEADLPAIKADLAAAA